MFFKCVLVLCLCVTAVHMQRRIQLYSTDPNHGLPHHGSNEDEHIQFVRPSHDHQNNHFSHDPKINTRQTIPDQMTFFELLGRLVAEYLQRRGAIPGISSSTNHNHNNNNFVPPQQPPYIQNPCYINGAWRNCDSYQPPTSSGFDDPIFTQQSFQNLPPVRPQQPNRPQQSFPNENVSPRPVNNRPDNVSPNDESFNDIFNTTNAMSKKEKDLVKNLAFSSVFFQGITPDNPDPQNSKECTEEPGISIKKTVEWFLDNSDTDSLLERRCEFACIFEKMGILKDNSVLNKGFLRLTHELYKDLPSFRIISYMNRVLQCLDSLGNYGDRCATGAKLLICGFMKQTNYAGCMRGFTLINGGRQCAGETLFEDDFDSELEKFKWKPSVKISSVEDEEFVVYNQAPENIRIEDGKLIIQPTIMHDDMVQQGTLNLRKCTGYYGSPECFKKAESYNILPPVLSAQITSKFYFKYGRVEIRAKLPEGDWIVPQLWLIPKNKEFGPLYNSGRVLIAKCNGNPQLISPEGIDISARHLRMGTMLGVERDVRDRFGEEILPAGWHDHFHNFTLLWEPDGMSFFVDGILTKQIGKNDREPLVDSLRFSREDIASTWPNRTRMTPFDDEFRVRFGVSVGGNMDFPDNSITGKNHTKPWINKGSVKYLLNFWRDRQNWLSTWKSNRTALEIDYVRVNALL